MNKKGIELSIGMIIIIAIGLFVSIVLFIIFLGRINKFNPETDVCTEWRYEYKPNFCVEWNIMGCSWRTLTEEEYNMSIKNSRKICTDWHSKPPEELKIANKD